MGLGLLHVRVMSYDTTYVPDNAAGPGNERTFPAPFEFSRRTLRAYQAIAL